VKTTSRHGSTGLFKPSMIFAALALSVIILLWTKAHAADPAASSSPATAYLPSISDFMIATIQPRHIRLWLAVQDKNWDFAAYELGNLKGAFARFGHAHPTEHDISVQDMITSVTGQPFEDLGKAVRSKDTTSFSKAYADLTSGCNSCHQAMNHGVVVIRVPREGSVPDQDFSPAKP
jgi:hypothetical protein